MTQSQTATVYHSALYGAIYRPVCAFIHKLWAYPARSNSSGSSINCLIFTRKRTASLPSISRWS